MHCGLLLTSHLKYWPLLVASSAPLQSGWSRSLLSSQAGLTVSCPVWLV
jgi:hypothetical protein